MIIIEAELDGRECNLMVVDDFIPKVDETVWVRNMPDGVCFHAVVNEIKGEVFKVEEV